MQRIVILGGGFAGLAAARELDRLSRRRGDLDITLVNRDNFSLFTPMLHEVAASDLDLTHIVNPIRRLLRNVKLFVGSIRDIRLDDHYVDVVHGDHHMHRLYYDHLVIALGSVTNFYSIPGLAERAMAMKTLGDAVQLRSRLIQLLDEADFECAADLRANLLTVVVAGGGFAGVETTAAINDFLTEALHHYPRLRALRPRLVLVSAGDALLPELPETLGHFAQRKLAARGVEVRLGARVAGVESNVIELADGERIPAQTIVWTAGITAHPLVAALPCAGRGGRVPVDGTLAVVDWPRVWAVGDCAAIPDGDGALCPPTAQHALRQGRAVARNVVAAIDGKPLRPFRYQALGQLAAIGRRAGVAQILGMRFSGFVAWWLWRSIYLAKLPRLEKKVRVALDWTLDLVFSKDLTQFITTTSRAAAPNVAARGGDPKKPPTLIREAVMQ